LAKRGCGAVFHDGLDTLHQVRAGLQWYPHDLWRYVLACQWRRVAQEEGFVAAAARSVTNWDRRWSRRGWSVS
jgi:hypothetical protein